MSTLRVDTITDEAGTGPVEFTNGINVSGGTVTGVDPFKYNAVSGATQALDVGSYNFFDAGTLTADTTVSFSNVPTEARWTYTAIGAGKTTFDLSGDAQVGYTSEAGSRNQLNMKTDGTKAYIIDDSGYIRQYSLPTTGSINNMSYDSVFIQVTQPQTGWITDWYFKADGTSFYVCESNNNFQVYQYNLSTAWDLSTFSYVGASPALTSQLVNSFGALTFSPDGSKMYAGRGNTGQSYQYTLSTPWTVSTASYTGKSLNTNSAPFSEGYSIEGLGISSDGSKYFVYIGSQYAVFQYNLSTPFDISTASYSGISSATILSSSYTPRGIYFDPAGLFYVVTTYWSASASNYYSQRSLYELASITFPSSVQNLSSATPSLGSRKAYKFFTNDGGTTVWQDGAF